jgi:hypothetical protein
MKWIAPLGLSRKNERVAMVIRLRSGYYSGYYWERGRPAHKHAAGPKSLSAPRSLLAGRLPPSHGLSSEGSVEL